MTDDARERARAAREAAREARDAARRARDEAAAERTANHGQGRGTRGRRGPAGENATLVERRFGGEGVSRISVDHTAGKLTIRPCADDEEPVVISRGSKAPPEVDVTQAGTKVSIRVKLSIGRLFRRRQGADTEIRIPRALDDLSIEQGAGRVDLEGIETETLSVQVGAGDVNIRDCEGRLQLEVGAGKVAVREHRGTAEVDAGTGDVMVHFARADEGKNDVSVGMGSAEIQMPPGLQIDARLNSGIGRAHADYPLAGPGAPIHVRIGAGIGKAILRQASASPSGSSSPSAGPGASRPQRSARASEKSEEAGELRVLHLMQQGRITPKEAVDLLAALKGMPPPDDQDDGQDNEQD